MAEDAAVIPAPIADLRFGVPLALIALALVPLLVGLGWFEARRRRIADARYGGSSALRLGVAPRRRALQRALLLAALTLLVLAVARPQWGYEPQQAEQRGIDVTIVLDVSRSMSATDLSPSRARVAAQELQAMLDHLDGNRVALVTFAGSAFIRSPLTVDLPAVANLVDRAQGDAPLLQAGTNLRVAIEAALGLLDISDRASSQVIVLVSDGEDIGGADLQGAIDRANERHIAIDTVFAATETPTNLPAASGGTDVTRGDPRTLAAIARGTGGSTRDVRGMAGLAVDFAGMRQTQFGVADTRVPRDVFAWFIGTALVLLLVQAAVPTSSETPLFASVRPRRAALGTAVVTVMLLLTACVGGSSAFRHVESGNRLYDAGRFDAAIEEYRAAATITPNDLAIQYNIANAQIRGGHLYEARATIDDALAKTPDAALTTRLQYTNGYLSSQRNDLDRARAAFRQVLRQDAEDQDAKANLELVLRRTTPPSPPPSGEQGQQGQNGQSGQQGQSGQAGQQQPGGQQGQGAGSGTQPGGGGAGQPQPGAAGTNDPGGSGAATAANGALERALAELGPDVSPEEAARILELAQQANDLGGLTNRGPRAGGVPAR